MEALRNVFAARKAEVQPQALLSDVPDSFAPLGRASIGDLRHCRIPDQG